MVNAIQRGFGRFGHRLFSLFRDPPSWGEFISALGITAYGLSFFAPDGKAPEDWHSLSLLTDLLPGWWWPALTIAGGIGQFAGLYFDNRFFRAAAAIGAMTWTCFMARTIWPVYPWSPMLIQATTMLIGVNFLIVARHARDWQK